MAPIDVGKDFYPRLTNRDDTQGDGKHTAVEFREKYLNVLDNKESWHKLSEPIIFDFQNVKKIGPSFANEAFGYFCQYVTPSDFLKKIKFERISRVQMMIIQEELESAYRAK